MTSPTNGANGLGGPAPLFPLVPKPAPAAADPRQANSADGLSRDPDEVGKQFETLFLTYLVKELKLGRTPGLSGDGEGESVPGASVYEGLITNALAESLSRSGAFGIGEAVAEYVRNHSAGGEGAK